MQQLRRSVLVARDLARLFNRVGWAWGTQSSRSAAHPIDISDLRRVLHPDELLLEYVVSDAGSYCLAVSQSHSALIRLTKGRAALERAVRSYLSGRA